MKGNPRYALVRVDETRYCPSRYEKINRDFVCAGLPYCYKCRYGDTKEQLIRKVAQVLFRRKIKTYGLVLGKEGRKEVFANCLSVAKEIVEFLGVENNEQRR